MWTWITFGFVLSWMAAWAIWLPPARELVIKLGTLLDWARRDNPQLYAERLQPFTPFVSPKVFKLALVNKVLKADLSGFSEITKRLQTEAKRLDRRAHYALIPVGGYALAVVAWLALR